MNSKKTLYDLAGITVNFNIQLRLPFAKLVWEWNYICIVSYDITFFISILDFKLSQKFELASTSD